MIAGSFVIVVEHDLSVLDYLSDFVCCLYGVPGAYGVVTMPFSVREGARWLLQHPLAPTLPPCTLYHPTTLPLCTLYHPTTLHTLPPYHFAPSTTLPLYHPAPSTTILLYHHTPSTTLPLYHPTPSTTFLFSPSTHIHRYLFTPGINIFLDGFVPTENLRFRQVSLTFKVSENATEEVVKHMAQYEYPDMTKTLGGFTLNVQVRVHTLSRSFGLPSTLTPVLLIPRTPVPLLGQLRHTQAPTHSFCFSHSLSLPHVSSGARHALCC